jgi:hypothetical protein
MVNRTNGTSFFAEGKSFQCPNSAKSNKTQQFLQVAKKH